MPGTPKLQELDFNTPREGRLRLLVARPVEGYPWGGFTPFMGTPWAALVREIPVEAMNHAYHGWFDPLLRALGPHPHARGRQMPTGDAECQAKCVGWVAGYCRVGGVGPRKKDPPGPPDCFVTGIENGELVALLIREGRHPVVLVDDNPETR